MLNHEKIQSTIDLVSEELCEALDNLRAKRTWDNLHDAKNLTKFLLSLKCLKEDMSEIEDSDSVEYAEHEDHHSSDKKPKETPKMQFTAKEAENWVKHLVTRLPDGSTVKGGHWTIDQTNSVAKQKGIVWEHIQPYHFWVTMNMIYSDYLIVASKHGVDTVDFYYDLTRAFLFDVDSVAPGDKLCYYYHYIVKPAIK